MCADAPEPWTTLEQGCSDPRCTYFNYASARRTKGIPPTSANLRIYVHRARERRGSRKGVSPLPLPITPTHNANNRGIKCGARAHFAIPPREAARARSQAEEGSRDRHRQQACLPHVRGTRARRKRPSIVSVLTIASRGRTVFRPCRARARCTGTNALASVGGRT